VILHSKKQAFCKVLRYSLVKCTRLGLAYGVNATFNNISAISWWSVLLVEETKVPRENHWPVASHWQTLSHNVVSSTFCLGGIQTHNVSGDRHRLHDHDSPLGSRRFINRGKDKSSINKYIKVLRTFIAFLMLDKLVLTVASSLLKRVISWTRTVFMLWLYDVGYLRRAASMSYRLESLDNMSAATSSTISSVDFPPPDDALA